MNLESVSKQHRPWVALRRRPWRSRIRHASSAHATTASLRLPVCVTSATIGSPLGVSIGTLYSPAHHQANSASSPQWDMVVMTSRLRDLSDDWHTARSVYWSSVQHSTSSGKLSLLPSVGHGPHEFPSARPWLLLAHR